MIVAQGLDAYYRHREGRAPNPSDTVPDELRALELFDDPDLQRDFVHPEEGDSLSASLSVEGMTCAACAWLIERHLLRQPGVLTVHVGLTSHRARVAWDPMRTRISAILSAIRELGFGAHPYEPDRQEEMLRREQRQALRRLGVAGLATMQVMMFAVGLYAGALQGISDPMRDLLRFVSLLVATVVVFYSARPFFRAAWRDIRVRQPGMDVPVALAIGSAYAASAWATITRSGEVYFDSVCMFTFFLGLGRYLEGRMRLQSDAQVRGLLSRTPQTARRLGEPGEEQVPVRALGEGDLVSVRPGETIPADGRVIEGESAVSEALWTGEARPLVKGIGDFAIGGSQNMDAPLTLRVERAVGQGTLAIIQSLLDRAQLDKPRVAHMADRLARGFVTAVLIGAAAVGAVWWQLAPERAFWVVLSVLVATCPCALSLATPAVLAAATNRLANTGFLITRGHVLEALSRLDAVVFDKTGTLTNATPKVETVVVLGARDRADVLDRARALEAQSEHPIARAFAALDDATDELPAALPVPTPALDVAEREANPGRGVGGRLDGDRHRLGQQSWVSELFDDPDAVGDLKPPSDDESWLLLGNTTGPLAWFSLRTTLRPSALPAVTRLREQGVESALLSGDPSLRAVAEVAEQLGIESVHAGASPEAKVRVMKEMQTGGALVAAVGDGVNDAPLLGQAQVSVAMGGGTDLARVSADAVLLCDDLEALATAIDVARQSQRIIRQNLTWALLYNITVLPLAAGGFLAPYAAAIGMSASSLLVVANALRIHRSSVRKARP